MGTGCCMITSKAKIKVYWYFFLLRQTVRLTPKLHIFPDFRALWVSGHNWQRLISWFCLHLVMKKRKSKDKEIQVVGSLVNYVSSKNFCNFNLAFYSLQNNPFHCPSINWFQFDSQYSIISFNFQYESTDGLATTTFKECIFIILHHPSSSPEKSVISNNSVALCKCGNESVSHSKKRFHSFAFGLFWVGVVLSFWYK